MVLMVLVGISLLLGLLWLVQGSLEMFPTAEQQGKARIGAVIVIGCSLLAEGVLWSVLRTLRR